MLSEKISFQDQTDWENQNIGLKQGRQEFDIAFDFDTKDILAIDVDGRFPDLEKQSAAEELRSRKEQIRFYVAKAICDKVIPSMIASQGGGVPQYHEGQPQAHVDYKNTYRHQEEIKSDPEFDSLYKQISTKNRYQMKVRVENGSRNIPDNLYAVRGLIAQTVAEDIINNLDHVYAGGVGESKTDASIIFDERNGNMALYEVNESLV